MIAFLFPGQGSQFVGMGKELFDKYKEYADQADEVLGYSIKELCLEDKDKLLGLTQYTQPALYIVNALSCLQELENGIVPDFLAGHSLGEYNALFAGGVFDFTDGLKLVKKRGELMGHANGGKMMAVKNLPVDKISQVLSENGLESIDIANLNIPSQTIISGTATDIENARTYFKEAGGIAIPLNVSGAFHSRYMKPAALEFAEYIKGFEFHDMKIPIISNYTGRIHRDKEIKDNMIKQIYNPVQWVDSIRYIWGKGVEEFKQIGPGNVVINLANKIKQETSPLVEEEKYPKQEEPVIEKQESPQKTGVESIEPVNYEGILGSKKFMERYHLSCPCIAGPMHKGISGFEFVKRLADSKMLGFVGTRGLSIDEVEQILVELKEHSSKYYGVSVDYDLSDMEYEKKLLALVIRENVSIIHASGYFNVTESLILYKLHGIKKLENGKIFLPNKIFLKTTRPEIAEIFMSPIPDEILKKLYDIGEISEEQVTLAKKIPVADEIIIVFSGADKTGMIPISALLPQVIQQRALICDKYGYMEEIHIGAAGAIGDPISALEAFLLGADFIMTGSINQCTAEAKVSTWVKDKLQKVEIQDTEIIPCGNVYEIGMKVQVLKKGVFFAARALKLYEIYNRILKIEDIEYNLLIQIQDKYFGKSIDDIYNQVKDKLKDVQKKRAETDSKYKFGLIINWYYDYCAECAIEEKDGQNMNCMVPISSAMGRMNLFLENSIYQNWEERHPDILCRLIMSEAEEKLIKIAKKYHL